MVSTLTNARSRTLSLWAQRRRHQISQLVRWVPALGLSALLTVSSAQVDAETYKLNFKDAEVQELIAKKQQSGEDVRFACFDSRLVKAAAAQANGELGLLPPSRIGSNGYRYYDARAVVRLQRILLLRELGLGLAQIAQILERETSEEHALAGHLVARQTRPQESRHPPLLDWEGGWVLAIVPGGGRPPAERSELRAAGGPPFAPPLRCHVHHALARPSGTVSSRGVS